MRPILRPGTHVLRRGDRHLQVGLDPDHAVVLPDDPAVRGCLNLLARSADIADYAGPGRLETLAVLRDSGLLMDSGGLLPLLPVRGEDHSGPGRSDVAAAAVVSGDAVATAVRARRECPVEVVGFGPQLEDRPDGGSSDQVQELATLLDGAGVPASRTGRPAGRGRRAAALVGLGEPARELLDLWVRDGVPHLVVRFTEATATVGPFVVPGRTACLRCIDGHHTDADSSWPLLVAQYAALVGRARADAVPEPVDPMVRRIAVAWAARDLVTYAEGRRPSTWSATLRLDPALSTVESRTWLRHPACGCSWD